MFHRTVRSQPGVLPTRASTRRTREFGPRAVECLETRELMSTGMHHLHRMHHFPPAFAVTNLVSDIPGRAAVTDPDLVNPWGIAFKPTTPGATGSPFWIADNGKGVATLYDSTGAKIPLTVTIPAPAGSAAGATSAPTGMVFNGTSDFKVSGSPAVFIFVTEDGTIAAWNPALGTTASIVVDHSAQGAVYKGAALATDASGNNFLFVTNFHDNKVEVYDKNFQLVNSFTDPRLPKGFAPFGIANVNGSLIVTFAKQNAAMHDDVAGRGLGFVDEFDTSGHLVRRIASRGPLNAPWGIAVAPSSFGRFGNDLLIGDFGDGRINAFRPITGHGGSVRGFVFAGQLQDAATHRPLSIDGLWALKFGTGGPTGDPNSLFFTAGINDEADGLFGAINAVPTTKGSGSM